MLRRKHGRDGFHDIDLEETVQLCWHFNHSTGTYMASLLKADVVSVPRPYRLRLQTSSLRILSNLQVQKACAASRDKLLGLPEPYPRSPTTSSLPCLYPSSILGAFRFFAARNLLSQHPTIQHQVAKMWARPAPCWRAGDCHCVGSLVGGKMMRGCQGSDNYSVGIPVTMTKRGCVWRRWRFLVTTWLID